MLRRAIDSGIPAGCQRTFREQVPGVLERYQRRTPRLAGQVAAVAREPAGRGAARLLSFAPGVIMQVLTRDGSAWMPADLLRITLADRKVATIRLPEPGPVQQPHAEGDAEYGPGWGELRQLTNVLPEGVVLVYWDGPSPRAVEVLDPISGVRQVITRFTGNDNWVRVRGDVDTL